MASMSGLAPGIRLLTAATAFAMAPFTAALADWSRDGSGGCGFLRVVRDAAARAAFLLRATLVVVLRAVARFAAVFRAVFRAVLGAAFRVRFGAVFRPPLRLADFAVLRALPLRLADFFPDARVATLSPLLREGGWHLRCQPPPANHRPESRRYAPSARWSIWGSPRFPRLRAKVAGTLGASHPGAGAGAVSRRGGRPGGRRGSRGGPGSGTRPTPRRPGGR